MEAIPILQRIRLFVAFLFGRFIDARRLSSAAGLSYASLLAIVPMVVVSLAVLSAFPVFQTVMKDLQDFVFQNFVPDSRGEIQKYILGFASKASRLTIIGIVSMLLTALLLMASIDKALNEIWHVRHRRKRLVGFLVYWAVLTLGPLLIGSSLAITSYLASLPLLSDVGIGGLKKHVLPVLPFVMESVAFAMMYWIVPNRSVQFKHALLGGLLAAIIFELAKKAFAFYLTHFPTYQAIYGALAAIPIFLIWMYASWIIILFGAEFTYCLGAFRERLSLRINPDQYFIHIIRLLGYLWQAQQSGRLVPAVELSGQLSEISDQALQEMLERMEDSNIAHKGESGDWGLSRDTCNLTIMELLQSGPYPLPRRSDTWPRCDQWTEKLAPVIDQSHEKLDQAMNISLHELFSKVTDKGMD